MYGTNCQKQRIDCSRVSREDTGVGVVAGVVSSAVLVVAFGALALGIEAWWVAFPLGYGGVLPLAIGLTRRRADDEQTPTDTDTPLQSNEDEALATLRTRYATGEIDEAEFEERVETLLVDETRREDSASSDR